MTIQVTRLPIEVVNYKVNIIIDMLRRGYKARLIKNRTNVLLENNAFMLEGYIVNINGNQFYDPYMTNINIDRRIKDQVYFDKYNTEKTIVINVHTLRVGVSLTNKEPC